MIWAVLALALAAAAGLTTLGVLAVRAERGRGDARVAELVALRQLDGRTVERDDLERALKRTTTAAAEERRRADGLIAEKNNTIAAQGAALDKAGIHDPTLALARANAAAGGGRVPPVSAPTAPAHADGGHREDATVPFRRGDS